ncbi:some similarities with Kazachstania africana KAFR_0D02200 hypothetical protein [Maudiozyma barnettii]|uniref:Uncharacterized protein n=1 Tax=Maudiozyma barnettii TaxID=61262 RepID=A0A8H2ZJ72_9SACH|nr:uncharacterized protein KABA2_09S00352 [Kazachstania barnettii]CAB4256247.1 some similarities with Kazachstania africana KAFR_0D02200 hypothetical protein [Kazachstania barnettii]CAD1784856.1 some similarities with Kazachstania africana KAFR_0D02200 hypothetical protein [Kazachstania barnettii]
MKRRDFVKSPVVNRSSDQQEAKSITELRLSISKRKEYHLPDISLTQLSKFILKKKLKKPLESQNVNISKVINSFALKKKNLRRSQITSKSSSLTSIVKRINKHNRYHEPKIVKWAPLNDILTNSKIKDTNTELKYSFTSYNDYIKKPPIDETSKLYQGSILSTLHESLWQFNSKLKLLEVHDKCKYDTLVGIQIIKPLSSNEIMIITSHGNFSFILHNSRNDQHIPKLEIIQQYKLAIYSKTTIKLNDNLIWCLQWKFIQLNT